MSSSETIMVTVEFSGGLELLFSNQRKHTLTLPSSPPTTIRALVLHLCDTLMKDPRRDLFVMDGTVRPGILVLINDADWELEGEDAYEVQNGDSILFVSTLHGG